MVRHSLAAALWLVAGLLASFLGAMNALVGTGAGRQLLTRIAIDGLKRVVDGTAASAHARDAGSRAKPMAELGWQQVEKILRRAA